MPIGNGGSVRDASATSAPSGRSSITPSTTAPSTVGETSSSVVEDKHEGALLLAARLNGGEQRRGSRFATGGAAIVEVKPGKRPLVALGPFRQQSGLSIPGRGHDQGKRRVRCVEQTIDEHRTPNEILGERSAARTRRRIVAWPARGSCSPRDGGVSEPPAVVLGIGFACVIVGRQASFSRRCLYRARARASMFGEAGTTPRGALRTPGITRFGGCGALRTPGITRFGGCGARSRA